MKNLPADTIPASSLNIAGTGVRDPEGRIDVLILNPDVVTVLGRVGKSPPSVEAADPGDDTKTDDDGISVIVGIAA